MTIRKEHIDKIIQFMDLAYQTNSGNRGKWQPTVNKQGMLELQITIPEEYSRDAQANMREKLVALRLDPSYNHTNAVMTVLFNEENINDVLLASKNHSNQPQPITNPTVKMKQQVKQLQAILPETVADELSGLDLSKAILAWEVNKYKDDRASDKREYTNVFNMGYSRTTKIDAAQAFIDALEGNPSALLQNIKDSKHRDAHGDYMGALKDGQLGKTINAHIKSHPELGIKTIEELVGRLQGENNPSPAKPK